MNKYYIEWSIEFDRIPEEPAARSQFLMTLIETVTHDLEAGKLKDWGTIPGAARGYCIAECEAPELAGLLVKYFPSVRFDAHPVIPIQDSQKAVGSLTTS